MLRGKPTLAFLSPLPLTPRQQRQTSSQLLRHASTKQSISKTPSSPTMTTTPRRQTAGTIAQQALLRHLSTLKLGRKIINDNQAIRETDNRIEEVEALNETSNPTSDPRLGGKWKLVYSTSRQVIGANQPPGVQLLESLQYVDVKKLTVINEEVLKVLGGVFSWKNAVEGEIEVVDGKKFNVRFKKFVFNGLLGVPAPGKFRGSQEITYLDDDFRIARGNLGNVFVLVRDE